MLVVSAGNGAALRTKSQRLHRRRSDRVPLSGAGSLFSSFHERSTPSSFAVRPFPADSVRPSWCRVGGGAPLPGLASVRRSNPACRFPALGFHKGASNLNAAPQPVQCGRPVCLSSSLSCHVSSDTDFWVFHIGNLSTSAPLLPCQPLRLHHLCPPPSPAHIAAFVRSRRFHDASGTIRRSDYSPSLASHFAFRL